MLNVTLRQLRIFEAVARHLSFTRASQELHLTQPAVSMQIKQLEELIRLPLFEQIGKKIFLTDAGREMYHYCSAIGAHLEEAQGVFDKMLGLDHGRLDLTIASTANYFLPNLLAPFCQAHPAISINIDVTNRETLLKKLNANMTDLAIMGRPPTDLLTDARPFMANPLVIIAPPKHHLANKKRIPLKALQKETFIMREAGSGTRIATERYFEEHGLVLNTSMEMSSNEAIKQAVQAGLGLGLLSAHTIEMECQLKRLVMLKVSGLPIMREWYLVHTQGKRLSHAAQAFMDFALKESRRLIKVPNI